MFPGARAANDAAYGIVGAPLERSTTFHPGARFGPERIRHFARGFEDYDHRTDQRFSELRVADHGDVRAWQNAEEYLSFLEGELTDIIHDGAIPVLLGGEHTVSVAGVRACDPDVFVSIDAHLDLRSSFDGDPWSHATTTHHALDTVEEAIILGARAGSGEEWSRARSTQNITPIAPPDVEHWIETAQLADQEVYLSIDIDGVDPGFAPATGTREPFGLSPPIVREVIDALAPQSVGFDLVEVTDRDDGQTATLAAKLLRECIYQHATG